MDEKFTANVGFFRELLDEEEIFNFF